MAFGIIYKVTFPNDKVYIGQTRRTLKQRKQSHYNNLQSFKRTGKGKYVIMKAFDKYGFENTKWEQIDTANSQEELNKKEKYWIKYYKSYIGFAESNGYNSTLGGDATPIFTQLNDKELYECGLEIKRGKSKAYIIEKFGITPRFFTDISRGKKWSEYTKIPRIDPHIDEYNSILNRCQVDRIIKIFKQTGDAQICADEVGCDYGTVIGIVKGRHWSNYTGIIDETTFYRKFSQKVSSYVRFLPQILELRSKGFTNEQIGSKLNLNPNSIQGITSGVTLNKYTKIKHKTRDEQIIDGSIPTAKTSIEDVLKVVELFKKGKEIKDISNEINLPYNRVKDITTGKKWSKLTGIKYKATGKHVLAKEDVLEIIKLKKEGKTNKELSNQFNITQTSVSYILNGKTWSEVTGIKYTPSRKRGEYTNSVTKEQVDKILEMYNNNNSIDEIHKITGIKKANIKDILNGRTWFEYTGINHNK